MDAEEFLIAYATRIGLSPLVGTAILSATNVTTSVSQVGTGYLADICDSIILMAASSLLSGVAVLAFWGTSNTLVRLLSFGILYGLASGGFSVLCSRFATTLSDDLPTQNWLFALFDVQRGVVVMAGGIASGSLVYGPLDFDAYGIGEYKMLIAFAGASFVAGALGGASYFVREKTLGARSPSERESQDIYMGGRGLPTISEGRKSSDMERGFSPSDGQLHSRSQSSQETLAEKQSIASSRLSSEERAASSAVR